MPTFPIIDTHVHFWDRDAVPISWMTPMPAIDRRFLPGDLDADRGKVALEGLVFVEANVEPGQHLAEVDWVGTLAADDPRILAIVAHAPLERGPAVKADLEKLASSPLVRGIRRLIQGSDAVALCGNPDFVAGVRAVAEFDMHFELCILHHQLAPVLTLVEQCPQVRFVLDHIAKPGIKDDLREPWWSEIERLAGFDNVICKLSGVATEADHEHWTEEQLRPYLARVMAVFGPDRLMFGSDWPVMRLAIQYPRWVEILDRAIQDWSEAEQRGFYRDNARRVYRLG